MSRKWSFYGRSEELGALLEHLRSRKWFFGTIRGRRRIGKTALVQQALTTLAADEPGPARRLLVELPDSTPADLATVFGQALRMEGLDQTPGIRHPIVNLPEVAWALGALCASGITVLLDEFQVCHRGPLRGLPSLLKAEVDRLQNLSGPGGLILLGSVQSEMEALLSDRQAPLFGRRTFDISLGPWRLPTLFEVAEAHGAGAPDRILTLWTLFGGVPKYWRDYAALEKDDTGEAWISWAARLCQGLFLRTDSPLREEGTSLHGRELRRNHLAVLRAVARLGPCPHADLQTALPGLSLGPYLRTLTRDLRLIERLSPVFARTGHHRTRYVVSDPLLLAWLRVMQAARQAARIRSAASVAKSLVARLATLEGHAFERLVRDGVEARSRAGIGFRLTDRVRGYWNRPRTADASIELDLVAWNEEDRVVRFGSCKRNPAKHTQAACRKFREQVGRFLRSAGRRFASWTNQQVLFAPRFPVAQRAVLESRGWMCRDLADMRRGLVEANRRGSGPGRISAKVTGDD